MEKAKEFQENICFIDYFKAFDCIDHKNLWKIFRDWRTTPPYLSPEKLVHRLRNNDSNQTWKNQLVPNWERSVTRLYIVTLLI